MEEKKVNSFLNRLKEKAQKQTNYGGEIENTEAQMNAKDCPNCGAGRAKQDGVTHCAYCGFEFLSVKLTDGVYVKKKTIQFKKIKQVFGLFNKEKEEETFPEWYTEVQEAQQRWFGFLEKLEAKMEEFATAAIPELKEILQSDDDVYKRTFQRVLSGVNGQLSNIRQKARDIYEEKIDNLYYNLNSQISVLSKHHNLLSDFRGACSDRHNDFDDKYEYWRKQIDKTQKRDLEIEYQKIIEEYEIIKNKFSCTQCGGAIEIEKIFLIETYISCLYCKTQNTFAPSTQGRNLQNIARELAEQRTAHLYEAFETENDKERILYQQCHELGLTSIHETDPKKLNEIQAKMKDLEKQRKFVIQNAPKLRQVYLRAMYDEWNKITPDLKEHNEKMYQNQLKY